MIVVCQYLLVLQTSYRVVNILVHFALFEYIPSKMRIYIYKKLMLQGEGDKYFKFNIISNTLVCLKTRYHGLLNLDLIPY